MNEIKEKYIKQINKLIKKNKKLLSQIKKNTIWGYQTKVGIVSSSNMIYQDFREEGISSKQMREKPYVEVILNQTNRLISLFLDNPSNLDLSKDGDSYYIKGEEGITASFGDEGFFISYKKKMSHTIYEIYFKDNDLDKDIDGNLIDEYKLLYKKIRDKYSDEVKREITQKMR